MELDSKPKFNRCSLFESFSLHHRSWALRYFDSWFFVQTYFQPQELIIFFFHQIQMMSYFQHLKLIFELYCMHVCMMIHLIHNVTSSEYSFFSFERQIALETLWGSIAK